MKNYTHILLNRFRAFTVLERLVAAFSALIIMIIVAWMWEFGPESLPPFIYIFAIIPMTYVFGFVTGVGTLALCLVASLGIMRFAGLAFPPAETHFTTFFFILLLVVILLSSLRYFEFRSTKRNVSARDASIIPICSTCKKIRDDDGKWLSIETYFHNHGGHQFTHGICAECGERLFNDYLARKRHRKGA